MRVAYVGFTTEVIPGADKNLPDFKAPSNYKDAAKIKSYIDDAKDKFVAGLMDDPIAARFHSICVVREEGGLPVIVPPYPPETPLAEMLGANDAIAVFGPVRFLKFLTSDTLMKAGRITPDTAWTVRGESMNQALLPFPPGRNLGTSNYVFDPMRMFCSSDYDGSDVERVFARYQKEIGTPAMLAIAAEMKKLETRQSTPAAVLALKTYALGKLAAY